jgi:hypothetical protein
VWTYHCNWWHVSNYLCPPTAILTTIRHSKTSLRSNPDLSSLTHENTGVCSIPMSSWTDSMHLIGTRAEPKRPQKQMKWEFNVTSFEWSHYQKVDLSNRSIFDFLWQGVNRQSQFQGRDCPVRQSCRSTQKLWNQTNVDFQMWLKRTKKVVWRKNGITHSSTLTQCPEWLDKVAKYAGKSILIQEFNRCRKNDFNQASLMECPRMNLW